MIHWVWLFVALYASFGLLLADHDGMCYRNGFVEGHTEGFLDGMKELGKVG